MDATQAQEAKQLRDENNRARKPLADLSLDKEALQSVIRKMAEARNKHMQNYVSSRYEAAMSHCERRPVYPGSGRHFTKLSSWLGKEGNSPYILAGVILFSLLLCTGIALTRRPWCDEGWFASPVYNLNHHGFMGMTLLDPHGFVFAPYVQGIDRFTYWVLPGYLLLQAGWYKLAGFSLFSMRALSIVLGGVALCSWFVVVRWLTGSAGTALLATFLLGTEQQFVRCAATGRMDTMCAALGLLALAVYISLRQNFTRGLFVAACLSAINIFTHPNALFGVVALGVVILYFDRDRVTARALLIASIPIVVLALLWGLYVAQAPHLLVAQLQAQARIPHRLEFPWNPWKAVVQEILLRYGLSYGLVAGFPESLIRLILGSYVVAIFTTLVVPELRRKRGNRILLTLLALDFSLLMCIQKNWYYLIFILPCCTALLAIVLVWLWSKSTTARLAVVFALWLITGLQLGLYGVRILHNDYRGRFLKATDFLKHNAKPQDLIMGSGELAFQLGFDGQVLDDSRLGFLSGKIPEFIVLEAQYDISWFPWFAAHEPDTYAYIQDLITNKYEIVYDQARDHYPTYGFSDRPYRILKRREIYCTEGCNSQRQQDSPLGSERR